MKELITPDNTNPERVISPFDVLSLMYRLTVYVSKMANPVYARMSYEGMTLKMDLQYPVVMNNYLQNNDAVPPGRDLSTVMLRLEPWRTWDEMTRIVTIPQLPMISLTGKPLEQAVADVARRQWFLSQATERFSQWFYSKPRKVPPEPPALSNRIGRAFASDII